MEGTWWLIVHMRRLSYTKWFYAVTSPMYSISTILKRYCRTKFYTFRPYLLTYILLVQNSHYQHFQRALWHVLDSSKIKMCIQYYVHYLCCSFCLLWEAAALFIVRSPHSKLTLRIFRFWCYIKISTLACI